MEHEIVSDGSEVPTLEQDDEAQELGDLSALMDEIIHEFDFRGLRVRRVGSSMEVVAPNGEPLGGCLLMESASVKSAHQWLETKADYYGVN
jgi:hypothetical protein